MILESKLPKEASFASISGTTLNFTNLTETIPEVGFIRIGQEFIEYNGKSSTSVLNIRRNRFGSISRPFYPVGEKIFFFDHYFDATEFDNPILSISVANDYNFLANSIHVNYGNRSSAFIEDANSISTNQRKDATVDTLLGPHQGAWAKNLSETYLEQLKDLRQRIVVTLKASFYLKLGETIYLRFPDRARVDTLALICLLYTSPSPRD